MNQYVVDTSVVVKWFSTAGEADLNWALQLRQEIFEGNCQVFIPDLALYELGNALRFNPNFSAADVIAAMHSLIDMNLIIRPVESKILSMAIQSAFQYEVTLYDAYFLALAVETDFRLITADYKFYQKVTEVGSVVRLDKLFGEG
jgi:predicted nucleic acid-binding protein